MGGATPTLGAAAGPALREHLSQRIVGLVLTAAHTRGRHTVSARYDVADYNAGNGWYTAYDPYRESGPGVPRDADYTPRFTEVTFGYTFAWRAHASPGSPTSSSTTWRDRRTSCGPARAKRGRREATA